MNRKLWFLNLLLVAGLVWTGVQLRAMWRAAREREQRALAHNLKPAPAPPLTPAPPPAPVQAAGYIDVAQQMLFSKDRNPNVVIEKVAEAPKPLPPFPKFYGVMNFGDGPLAILSDAGRQKPFKTGDKVGEYKLLAIGSDTLTFEWDTKQHVKKFTELQDKTNEPAVPEARSAAPPPPTPAAPATPARPGPGADMGAGVSACNANDSSPAGTVVDGKRKVISESPFGKVCRWEPVR